MTNITLIFSFLLMMDAVVGYVNSNAWSSLIPAFFGFTFFIFALVSFRKAWQAKVNKISLITSLLLIVATAGVLPELFSVLSSRTTTMPTLTIVTQSFAFFLGVLYLLAGLIFVVKEKLEKN